MAAALDYVITIVTRQSGVGAAAELKKTSAALSKARGEAAKPIKVAPLKAEPVTQPLKAIETEAKHARAEVAKPMKLAAPAGASASFGQVFGGIAKGAKVAAKAIAGVSAAALGLAAIGIKAILETGGEQTKAAASKLSASFKSIFTDVGEGPLLAILQRLAAIIDTNTASGRAMRGILQGAFKAILAAIPPVIEFAQILFFTVAAGALRAWNALKPIRKVVADLFTGESGAETFKTSLSNVSTVSKVLAGSLIVIAAIVGGVFVAAMNGAAAAINAFDAAWNTTFSSFGETLSSIGSSAAYLALLFPPIWLAVTAFQLLLAAGSAVVSWWNSQDWGALGTAIIDGIVNAITAGAAAVGNAIKGVAEGAIAAGKAALGMASPSKVFAKQGRSIPQGLAVGVEAETATATTSVRAMATDVSTAGEAAMPRIAEVVMPQPKQTPTSTFAGSGGARTITITIGEVRIEGVQGAEDVPGLLGLRLAREIEAALGAA